MKVSIGGGLRVADLVIDGSEAEVEKTLAFLGFQQEGLVKNGTTGRASGATVTPIRPVAEKTAEVKPARTETKADKPAEKEAAKRGRPRKVEAELDEEDEDEDEDETPAPAKKGKKGKEAKAAAEIEIDPDAPELRGAKRLRDVVRFLMASGLKDVGEMISMCEELKPDVDILRRVTDMKERVTTAYGMIVKEAEAEDEDKED